MTFHFKPELLHLLKWFKDSPDTGDASCVCSFCAKVIEEEDAPLRAWRGQDKDTEELRLHIECAKVVVIEWSPPEKQYIHHPAFAEGEQAYQTGLPRGSNPYKKLGPQRFRMAWEAGWDDAWTRRDDVPLVPES